LIGLVVDVSVVIQKIEDSSMELSFDSLLEPAKAMGIAAIQILLSQDKFHSTFTTGCRFDLPRT
jgi:hypothetical protein